MEIRLEQVLHRPLRILDRIILPCLVILTATGCAAQVEWKTDSDLIFLHRAARAVAPECTMAAVKAAHRLGADGIEVDLRCTIDGVLVNFHDSDTLTKGQGFLPVEWMTAAELDELDGGAWFDPGFRGAKIARFEDILRFALTNGLLLHLDVKTPKIEPLVREMLDRYEAWHLIGASRGAFVERVNNDLPWLGGDLWRASVDTDLYGLAARIKAHPAPFRVSLDDPRVLADLLGRHPERRPLRTPAPRIAAPAFPVSKLPDVRARLRGSNRLQARVAARLLLSDHPTLALAELRPYIDPAPDSAKANRNTAGAEAAAWALGALRGERSVESLLELALRHPAGEVRALAAYSTGRTGFRGLAPTLRRIVSSDESHRARAGAAWALGRWRDRKAAKLLERQLVLARDERTDLERVRAGYHLTLALGRIGDPATTALVESASNGLELSGYCSIHALADIGGDQARGILGRLMSFGPIARFPGWTVAHMVVSCARLGTESLPALVKGLRRSEPLVANEITLALFRHASGAMPELERLLDLDGVKASTLIRVAVICRFSRGDRARGILDRLYRHPDPKVAAAAAFALRRLGVKIPKGDGPLSARQLRRSASAPPRPPR